VRPKRAFMISSSVAGLSVFFRMMPRPVFLLTSCPNFTDEFLSDSIRQAGKEIVARPEGLRSASLPA